jgi:phospholipase D3/4
VQHSGFAPEFDQESADLAAGRPNVQNATLLFEDWWGSGVLHAKVWISDKKDLYIGSANNDWKSLTQVYSKAKLSYILYEVLLYDCSF